MISLALAGMTVLAAAALVYPLIADSRKRDDRAGQATDDLTHRKVSIYRDIKDLEFDREMGKVSDVDYEAMQADYQTEAVQILRAMDRNGRPEGEEAGAEAACPGCGEAPGRDARFCPFCGRALREGCPSCGEPIEEGDRFCASCGHRVSQTVEE